MRKTIATIALTGMLLTGFTAPTLLPANAASEQPSVEHQISDLSLSIANDPRLLALGFSNKAAYAGAVLNAMTVAPGANRFEYFYQPVDYVPPSAGEIGSGPTFTLEDNRWPTETGLNLWVRATWPDGVERLASIPFDVGFASGESATFKAPKSIRPGASTPGGIVTPSAMTVAAGMQSQMRVHWYVQAPRSSWKYITTGDKPLAIQPSWRGKNLIAEVEVDAPEGWTINSSRVTIPVEDVAPVSVKVSLPQSSMGKFKTYEAKVTNLPAGSTQENQWMQNGKIVQDFTDVWGFQFTPQTNTPGDTLQANVRSVFTDGTVTAASSSNKIILSTPVFKAPSASLTGTATVGQKLTAVRGIGYVPPRVTIAHTWLRDGKAIPKAASSSYTLTAADADKRISVRTSYKPFDRAAVTATSKATAQVKRLLMRAPYLQVTGTTKPGKTLTVKALQGKAGASIKYQWLRNGTPIKGATKTSFKLTKADAKKRILVRGTSTYPGYKTTVSTSYSKLISAR